MIRLEVGIQGDVRKTLKDFEKKFQDQVIISAARKASRPIVSAARGEVGKIANKGQSNDPSKAAHIMRSIKAFQSKSKNFPGVAIYTKGSDLWVYNRFWKVGGYAVLVGEGSYQQPDRKRYWRKILANGKKKYTGRFHGFGNFMEKGFQQGVSEASAIFMKEIDNVIQLNK